MHYYIKGVFILLLNASAYSILAPRGGGFIYGHRLTAVR